MFWPRFVGETIYKYATLIGVMLRLMAMKASIARDPRAAAYMDQALTPVTDDDDSTLDLMTMTTGASAAIAHNRRVAELTRAGAVT